MVGKGEKLGESDGARQGCEASGKEALTGDKVQQCGTTQPEQVIWIIPLRYMHHIPFDTNSMLVIG